MTPEGASATDIGLGRTIVAGGMAGIANWVSSLILRIYGTYFV